MEIDGTEHVVSPATLDSLAQGTVQSAYHGRAPRTYVGVAVSRLLSYLGVEPQGLRGPEPARYLVVEAADGYRVVPLKAQPR